MQRSGWRLIMHRHLIGCRAGFGDTRLSACSAGHEMRPLLRCC